MSKTHQNSGASGQLSATPSLEAASDAPMQQNGQVGVIHPKRSKAISRASESLETIWLNCMVENGSGRKSVGWVAGTADGKILTSKKLHGREMARVCYRHPNLPDTKVYQTRPSNVHMTTVDVGKKVDIHAINELLRSGVFVDDVAKMTGVSIGTIRLLARELAK